MSHLVYLLFLFLLGVIWTLLAVVDPVVPAAISTLNSTDGHVHTRVKSLIINLNIFG